MEAIICTGAAANLCSGSITGIFGEIKRHVRYVFIQKKNVEKFEERMKSLIAKRVSVQQKVDAAKRNLETIYEDVNHWCQQVDNTINEEEKNVKDLVDQAKAKCFVGLCPSIKSRYQLSRKAEEYVAAVDELLRRGEFGRVGFRDVLEAPISAATKNFTDFVSRNVVFDDVMEALKDSTTSMIGVYGMGGIGKTTLVKKVAKEVKEAKLFCHVVLVTVTQNPNIEKIQGEIAKPLGLKYDDESSSTRACLLRKRLENEKILIVLDDIWEQLDLEEVGIRFGDQNRGCKMLLTSRDQNVLNNGMDAEKIFPIDGLKEEEAWDLFKKMADNNFENSELQSVAIKVAKKCAGLPLAIVTVARALKNKELPEWEDALLRLQRPSPENFTGIPEDVYSAIQLSFNYLKSEELKKTFLLNCLLGRDAHIQDLLRYAMGLRLFDGVNTVAETRNRVFTMVSKLRTSCLLLDGYDDRLVMHDLVWDFAFAIASKDNHAFVLRPGEVFEEWPDEERMEKFKMICLNFASIKNLPNEWDCPQLTLFSMASRGWNSYVEMPPSFFEKTKDIKVLDLMGMDFSSSPSSVSLPRSLRTLCLKRCRLRLGDMASLGELKNLEILNLSWSNIEVLHEGLGQLKKLKLLDMSGCIKLRIIPPGVLSSLSRLEELYVSKVIVPWNRQDNARLDELKELSSLTALHICILDVEIVPNDLFSEKLERYDIRIGTEWSWWARFKYSRTLNLKVNTSADHLDDGIKGLLKKTKALYLEGEGSPSVPQHELPLFGKQIELPLLENLRLSEIKVVGRIWHNQFSTLENLTNLEIIDCDNLKDILSSSTAKSLAQLKSFEIRGCKHLRGIIFNEDIEEDNNVTISFPSLKKLVIEDCPKLKGFIYKSTIEDSIPLSMQAVFDEKVTFSQLEELTLDGLKNCRKIWSDQFVDDSFSKLKSLFVCSCESLLNIFPFNMSERLKNLVEFTVQYCDSLEEIFEHQIMNAITPTIVKETAAGFLFPKLAFLRFERLPKLKSFYSKIHTSEWPSLKKMVLYRCNMVEIVFDSGSLGIGELTNQQPLFWLNEVTFPSLEELKLKLILRKIWYGQLRVDAFNKLRVLELEGFPDTSPDFPNCFIKSLHNLERLLVGDVAFSCNEIDAWALTSLKELSLAKIPQLTHLWKEEYNLSGVWHNLRSLKVWDCGKLKNLVPSSVSF